MLKVAFSSSEPRAESDFTILLRFMERAGWSVSSTVSEKVALVLRDGVPPEHDVGTPSVVASDHGAAHTIYLRAIPDPNHPEKAIGRFRALGFQLACVGDTHPHLGQIRLPYGRHAGSKFDVVVEDVLLPDGIWGGWGEMRVERLEASSPFVLCPESGGFLPLLTAPLKCRLEPPEAHPFGLARRPFCFAGVAWRPTPRALFACDMFSDPMISKGENGMLVRHLLSECAAAHLDGAMRRLALGRLSATPLEEVDA